MIKKAKLIAIRSGDVRAWIREAMMSKSLIICRKGIAKNAVLLYLSMKKKNFIISEEAQLRRLAIKRTLQAKRILRLR